MGFGTEERGRSVVACWRVTHVVGTAAVVTTAGGHGVGAVTPRGAPPAPGGSPPGASGFTVDSGRLVQSGVERVGLSGVG